MTEPEWHEEKAASDIVAAYVGATEEPEKLAGFGKLTQRRQRSERCPIRAVTGSTSEHP
jgi:hypothetical protein